MADIAVDDTGFSAVVLDRRECLELMARARIGRVVFNVHRIPVALPVNVSVLDEDIIFCTDVGAKLNAVLLGQVVTVEVDHVDPLYRTGWSVLITGIARLVPDGPERDQVPLERMAWAPGPHPFMIRVPSTVVSGRRLMWAGDEFTRVRAMTADPEAASQPIRRIPARVPAHVDGGTMLRAVAQAMVETGVGAVVVEASVGPVGLVTAKDVVAAIADGADPDICWAGEIMHPIPRVVSSEQFPVAVGEEMAAYELEVVTVVDAGSPLGVASALDVLGCVVRSVRDPEGSSS